MDGGDRRSAVAVDQLDRVQADDSDPVEWEPVVCDGATGTAPHADSRDMVFDERNHSILQVDDGGIYRLRNPDAFPGPLVPRDWISQNGNLAVNEMAVVAYDPVFDRLIGGTQDNGVLKQSRDIDHDPLKWAEVGGGDGVAVAVEADVPLGVVTRYWVSNSFESFRREIEVEGAPALWNEFGKGMPNALVSDLVINMNDKVLVAATIGRGAFLMRNIDRALVEINRIRIVGDDLPGMNDKVYLVRDERSSPLLNICLNNDGATADLQVPVALLEGLEFDGVDGANELFVDLSNGSIPLSEGIQFHGWSAADTVEVADTSGGGTARWLGGETFSWESSIDCAVTRVFNGHAVLVTDATAPDAADQFRCGATRTPMPIRFCSMRWTST